MVSVILPTYNRADKLMNSVESVLHQTERDFELIIVDDGSKDRTKELILALGDQRVRYIYQEQAGACRARNTGVSMARGEYIAFHDSDDLWKPDKLERQLQCLEETGADLVFSPMEEIYPDGSRMLLPSHLQEGLIRDSDCLLGVGTQTLLGRREVFCHCPFDEEMPRLQEFEMLCRAREQYKLYFLDHIVVEYCRGADSISSNTEKLLRSIDLLKEKHPDLFKRSPQTAEQLAYRLLWDADAAFERGDSQYRTYLHSVAELWPSEKFKLAEKLGDLGLYGIWKRVRDFKAKGRDSTIGRLARRILQPVRAIRSLVREIAGSEGITDYPRKKKAFGACRARRLAASQIVDILTGYHTDYHRRMIRKVCDEISEQVLPQLHQATLPAQEPGASIPVWTLWWEGTEQAPECVKICLDSQRKAFCRPNFSYQILTKENYRDYVTLPPVITERFGQGSMSVTHFSDVLRSALLEQRGGLWVDATIFMSAPIDRKLLQGEFFTNHKRLQPRDARRLIPQGRWACYLMQAQRGNRLMRFLSKAYEAYWQKYDTVIDYYLLDALIDAAWRHIPEVRQMIDHVPLNNEGMMSLYAVRNETYTEKVTDQIFRENSMHKLSYKYPCFNTDRNGRMTVWRWIREAAGIEI